MGRYLNEARKWLPAERGPGCTVGSFGFDKTELRTLRHENAPTVVFIRTY